jgi:hypothetical protein
MKGKAFFFKKQTRYNNRTKRNDIIRRLNNESINQISQKHLKIRKPVIIFNLCPWVENVKL